MKRNCLFVNSNVWYGLRPSHKLRDVQCYALDITSWDSISDEMLKIGERKQSVIDLAAKLPDFTDNLSKVPAEADSTYATIVEQNNRRIVDYVKKNAVAALGTKVIDQTIVDEICDPATYSLSGTGAITAMLSQWGKFWSDFNPDFLKAVSIKVQKRIDIRDRFDGLGLDSSDVSQIERDVRKLAFLTSEFSQKTSKVSYLQKTTPQERQEDKTRFDLEVAKAQPLARIVDMTLENIPPIKIWNAKRNFGINPKNRENKAKLDAAVLAYKAAQVKEYKRLTSTGGTYNLEEYFNLG